MMINQTPAALSAYRQRSDQQALITRKVDTGEVAPQGNGAAEAGLVQGAGSQNQDSVSVTSQGTPAEGVTQTSGSASAASAAYDPWATARESMGRTKTSAELSVITVRKDFNSGMLAYQGAASQINDANIAAETSKLQSIQGLKQAGVASLQQTNTVQQSALNLIG
jgi:hypothetical protein